MSDGSDTTNQDAIERQQKLLATHRERLAVLLAQYAHFGAHVAPHILTDIRTTQEALRPIKAWLRATGVTIEDEPNDEAHYSSNIPNHALAAPAAALAGPGASASSRSWLAPSPGTQSNAPIACPRRARYRTRSLS